MFTAPLAYKYVATAVMLMEINYCAARLHLPLDLPVREQDIRRLFIPNNPGRRGFSGSIDTSKYAFSFARSARLKYIVNLTSARYRLEGGSPQMNEYLEKLTHTKSLIDTNGAYRIATNWLTIMEVDVTRLEHERHGMTTQWMWMGSEPLPIFDVTWDYGGRRLLNGELIAAPAISVLIAGDTGELIHLMQEDDTFSKRPAALVKDMNKLLAIPDEEFLKYTPEQRSNLVAEFAAVQYPPMGSHSTPVPR